MAYKLYDIYHIFFPNFCTGVSGIRIWPMGIDFGSLLVDFRIRESTLGPLNEFWLLEAVFVPMGISFAVCKKIVLTIISTRVMQNYNVITIKKTKFPYKNRLY